jgi:NADH-quinone oxidoreductase subunit J
MNVVFFLSAAVAIAATVMMITRTNAMHALLYLILSFLAVALIFYTLGAPFIAALEVIVYAGAIMVLFIFAIMLLNLGAQASESERQMLRATGWVGPAVLALILLGEVVFVLAGRPATALAAAPVEPQQVGAALFSTYLLGVELASILLLASLVGAYHLGQPRQTQTRSEDQRVLDEENAELAAVGPEPPAWRAESERAGHDFFPAPPGEGREAQPTGDGGLPAQRDSVGAVRGKGK